MKRGERGESRFHQGRRWAADFALAPLMPKRLCLTSGTGDSKPSLHRSRPEPRLTELRNLTRQPSEKSLWFWAEKRPDLPSVLRRSLWLLCGNRVQRPGSKNRNHPARWQRQTGAVTTAAMRQWEPASLGKHRDGRASEGRPVRWEESWLWVMSSYKQREERTPPRRGDWPHPVYSHPAVNLSKTQSENWSLGLVKCVLSVTQANAISVERLGCLKAQFQ